MVDSSSATSDDQNKEKEIIAPKDLQQVIFGESHSIQITTFRLNGSNYFWWHQSIQLYICGRGKLGYLNGERPKPDTADP